MSDITRTLERLILENPLGEAALEFALAQMVKLPSGPCKVQTTYGLRVPMRDRVALIADHFAPVGLASGPAVLIRTPYGRSGPGRSLAEMYARAFATHGYHVLNQDVRGRFDSEGEFVAFVHEGDDGYDTLAWMARQPWCNGAVGMWGASYLGYVQWAAAASRAPSLKALLPIITHSHLMEYHAQGFPLDLLLRWMFQLAAMDDPALSAWERLRRINSGSLQDRLLRDTFMHLPMQTADALAIGKPDVLFREMSGAGPQHPVWQQVDHRDAVGSAPPAAFISGWYDLFLDGLLEDYAVQATSGRGPRLVVGPWHHMDYGYMAVAFNEGLRWFATHLRNEPANPDARPVRLYVMGANRWREFDQWPPRSQPLRLYLHGNGVAKTGRLFVDPAPTGAAPDVYLYDPADPTPSLGGPKLSDDAGGVDNRPLERRKDVLVFSSIPLREDVEFAGPVQLDLYVKSSLSTADFFGRLCVVDRSGRSTNICEGIYRVEVGRGEVQPDGSVHIIVALSSTAYRVKAGERIRVLVASGAHPRFARNLGVSGNQALATEMIAAQQTVFHDAAHPSALVLPMLRE
ncbi:CocE/NonD family hydrolase [Caldilinea sp.]|uniref:CocE/NonD family hydrolase n=1 Tax=Caldilinea sp. TaxID=2293560 RepID=UPI002C3453D0|nr:CocE/NonD family hydrolase [Anaerolineales bacterium]HQY90593.1 CocE/NonD family hydrolase [Caldilinea sp.]